MLAGTASVAGVAAMLAGGLHAGYPADRPRLLSGAAWLTTAQTGQLTLLDGSSAEVAAQVQVGQPGDRIDVVQQGSTAYAVNRSAGTIRRVDPATFQPGTAVTPIPDARAGLVAFAAAGSLVALDTYRGLLARADPGTLAGRGTPVSLASRVAPEATALDDAGRLWLLDPGTGDLVWVAGGDRHRRRGVTTPGAGLLTFAGGYPVVVDTRQGSAAVLDPHTGETRHTMDLDLRPDDRIRISGAAHADRLYLVADRGVLAACELTARACNSAIPLGAPGHDLGTAVETAGRVFVPDYTSGQVWVVDLAGSRVVARPQVLSPGTWFQLLSRDGLVFFNDPDSERAGVIRLDGGFRAVPKYQQGTGGDGVPGAGGSPPPPDPTQPQPPDAAAPPQPGTEPPPPAGAPTVRISVNNSNPVVGTAVTLRAIGSATVLAARWTFGDGQVGAGATTTHAWSAPQTYRVSVQATFPGGQTAMASVDVRVGPPLPKYSVALRLDPGCCIDSSAGICPPACTVYASAGQSVTITARAGAGLVFDGWTGDCAGKPAKCTLVMNGNKFAYAKMHQPIKTICQSCPVKPGTPTCITTSFDGHKTARFSGNVTDGSGTALKWTFTAKKTGATLSHTGTSFSGDFVPGLGPGNFPGIFQGCVTNPTTKTVAATLIVGEGP
jgi:PKD domain/Divergent InlB B-repeat domain